MSVSVPSAGYHPIGHNTNPPQQSQPAAANQTICPCSLTENTPRSKSIEAKQPENSSGDCAVVVASGKALRVMLPVALSAAAIEQRRAMNSGSVYRFVSKHSVSPSSVILRIAEAKCVFAVFAILHAFTSADSADRPSARIGTDCAVRQDRSRIAVCNIPPSWAAGAPAPPH